MRRRDHERIVVELHRELTYLQRQNDELLNRVMYLTDRPWTPPPSLEPVTTEIPPSYDWTPEQSLDALEAE